jgi:hypothetical protein
VMLKRCGITGSRSVTAESLLPVVIRGTVNCDTDVDNEVK